MSVCLSICLSLSVRPSICLSLSVRLSVCLSVCLSVSLSVSVCLLFLCPSVCLSVCLSVCMSVFLCLSICLNMYRPLPSRIMHPPTIIALTGSSLLKSALREYRFLGHYFLKWFATITLLKGRQLSKAFDVELTIRFLWSSHAAGAAVEYS